MLAVILGGADCVFSDLARVRSMATPDLLIGVNHIGRDFDGYLDAICSTHSENIRGWLDERKSLGHPMPPVIIMNDTRKVPDELKDWKVVRAENYGGSSSQLAVMGALKMGCTKIILCGCPMTPTPHYDDIKPWPLYHTHRYAWEMYVHLMKNVRSCSGWTAELLGEPEQVWLSA